MENIEFHEAKKWYLSSVKTEVVRIYHDWLTKSENTSSEADKFIFIYIAYNALYYSYFELSDLKSLDNSSQDKSEEAKASKYFFRNKNEKQVKAMFNKEEKEKLEKIKNEIVTIIERKTYIYNYKNYRRECLKRIKNEGNIWELHSNIDLDDKIKSKLKANNNYKTKIITLLEVAYKIRCNLFHGGKENSSEQENNIAIGNKILRIIMPKLKTIWEQEINKEIN